MSYAVSFDNSTFHAAVFLYSIIHLPIAQQPVVLSHVARWLRPDGVLVLTAGVDAWIGSEDRWLGTTATMWWSQAETATYRRWLNDAGFSIVDEQVVPYSWPTGGVEAMCAAIRELFTDATVWVQAGLPTTTGADEAIAIVRSWGVMFPAYDSEIRHVASSGDVVLVERVDIMRRAGGSVALALPVMSIAEFDNGKIMRWNEYYDTAVVPGLGASQ